MAGQHCNTTVTQVFKKLNLNPLKDDDPLIRNLSRLCDVAYEKDANDKFSEPLVGIGIYIALASALCILAMLADLFLVPNRVRQIPYKHFSLNTATITVLSIAMKLPLDMTGNMPGYLDQATKLGSIIFLCTMMANLIPNLASMNNKTLVSNLIGLAILVITITVNLLIEMVTGVIDRSKLHELLERTDDELYIAGYRADPRIFEKSFFVSQAFLYIGSMLFLLIISVSAAVAIPSLKKVLESKYDQDRREALESKERRPTTLVELKEHVSKYWIMANTGSPHLVLTSGPLFAASLCICIVSTVTYIIVLSIGHACAKKFKSDYKRSMDVILVIQLIGIIVGDVTLLLRYFNSSRILLNYYSLISVDKFWYKKLCEWKGRHISLPAAASRRTESVVYTVRGSFFNLLIMFQIVFVLICKYLGLIPLLINITYRGIYSRCRPIASSEDEDLRNCPLSVEGDIKIHRYARHYLKRFMDGLVKKAEKKQNNNLLELLKKSNGFQEGQNFAISQVQIPPSVELKNWSLPVITLTCIAVVFPDQKQIDRLINSVDQALKYSHLVEEGFHSEDGYANMHNKTLEFWGKVKAKRKWLETSLKIDAFQGKTPTQILKWFDDKAEEAIVTSKSTVVNVEGKPLENCPDHKLMICTSMQSISRSILSKYENGTQLSTKEDVFQLLSSMIADILFACLSNIPQVITRKCHATEIEKREASVEAAVKILARTTKILEMFGTPKLPLPELDQHKMESIHEWRHPLIQPPTDQTQASIQSYVCVKGDGD